MEIKALINIEDPVIGSMHQITVENGGTIRLDGTTIPPGYETRKAVMLLLAAFVDDFAGITGKDVHLADVLAKQGADARARA